METVLNFSSGKRMTVNNSLVTSKFGVIRRLQALASRNTTGMRNGLLPKTFQLMEVTHKNSIQ